MKTALIIFFLLVLVCTHAQSQPVFNKLDVKDLKLPSETSGTAAIIDGDKKLKSSPSISSTEIEYLDGVSSNLQTQISGKQSTLTNSAGLRGALSDETGSGLAVFGTSPNITTP